MITDDFDAEDAIWNTLAEEDRRRQAMAASATPQVANRLGQIHRLAPSLAPGVKLAAAKGNLTDDQILEIAKKDAPIATTKRTTPKKKSFLDNVFSKFKTGTRYTFAGLQFLPDMVQNAASEFVDSDGGDISGWFISTELGSLIANDEEAGDGFFIGGHAKELQAERARRYRGEVDGKAWTLGRGLASVALKEDSKPYNIMSGAVDAAVAIFTPSIPLAGKVGEAARIAEESGDAGRVVTTVANVSRKVGKGSKEIGITRLAEAEREALRVSAGLVGDSVDLTKANRFFDTSQGRRIIERTAEEGDFSAVWDLWGKKLDPDTVMRLAAADTPAKVKAELLDVLGTEVRNVEGLSGAKRTYVSLAQRNSMLNKIPFGEGVSRTFSKMPRHSINLYVAETARDQIDQLDTLDRTLKLFKVAPEMRSTYINRAGELILNKDIRQIEKFYDDLGEEAKQAMVRFGTPRIVVDALYESFNKYKDVASRFAMDDLGDQTDFGAFRKIHGLQSGVDDVVYLGPQSTAEMARHEFFIPDPKQIRRLTNKYNKLWVVKDPNLENLKATGQLRLPLAWAEKFQEEVWRKYITATIGNFVRNTVDSTLSIAVSGNRNAAGIISHPVQWMSLMAGKAGRGTLNANDWDELISAGKAEEAISDLATATGQILNAHWQDPMAVARRQEKIGVFKGFVRPSNKIDAAVARAHGDEIGRLNADWAFRSMASSVDENGVVRGGLSIDEIIDEIRSGTNQEATDWFRRKSQEFRNGKPTWNNTTRELSYDRINLDDGDNLRYLLESFQKRLDYVTGKNPRLQNVVHLGYIPDELVTVKPKYVKGDPVVGRRVEYDEYISTGGKPVKRTNVGKIVSINPRTGDVEIAPYAFVGGNNSEALERLLASDTIYFDPSMPSRVVGEVHDAKNLQAATLKERMDIIYNKFHTFLYNTPISKLERAPLFKSLYYGWVDKLSESLDEASLVKLMDEIVVKSGGKPESYLTPQLWAKLEDLKANPNKLFGTLNAEDVSSYASAAAIDEYLKTVYNAVDRRNGTDVLRLLSPFAQQQTEFWNRMARFAFSPINGGDLGYLPNAKALRKLQLVVEGGQEADVDGDGRGLFYKDPNTGQWMFSFPMSGALTKAITGISATLSAPVKGVALALDYRPGLGPMATMAASAILPDSPSLDAIKNVILPYGEKTSATDALVPSYVRKIYDGVTGKSDGRFFANTYAETMQALSATGKYDLSDPDQRDAMMQDAKTKAQMLSILRGITQFTGPAAGDFDYKIRTDQGDVYASGLAAALQSLRNTNYDTATLRFIEIFGDDAFTYLSNKTVSEVGGLEGSKEFGDFERNNAELFRQYKDIAGYFGPVGTDFDFEVYTRQLRTGARRRLTPEEMVSAAENSIGLAYYKDMKNYLGPVITAQERQYLSQYRKKIQERYRGFGSTAYDPNKTPRMIQSLFEAAKRDDLKGNKIAEALNYYEKIRNAALAEAVNRGYSTLRSSDLVDLQQYVAEYAAIIISETPEFARVYERVLAQELQ